MPKKRRRRRGKHAGSVHRVGKKWRVSIMVNRQRQYAIFDTAAEAEAFRQECVNQIAAGNVLENSTFGRVREQWLTHIEATKTDNTAVIYRYATDFFGKFLHVQITNVKPVAIQQVLDTLSGRKAQLAYDKLKQCFKWAIQLGMIYANPMDRLTRPSHTRKPIHPFTLAEVGRILTEAEHKRYKPAIRLALFVGLRGGELWGLQWSDLNGTALTIQRQVAESGGKLHVRTPKTEAGIRTIALPDSVVDAIHDHKATLMAEGNASCEWMFPTSKGNPTSRTNFAHRNWRPLLEQCGIDHRGLHHCRHTAATLMLNAGVPITVVSRMLGHKDPSVTLSTYSHFMTTELEKHRNTFDGLLKAS